MTRGVKKENLPSKICVVCQRPYTWRKKWESCWDEVTTCSNSCNRQRKAARRATPADQRAPQAPPAAEVPLSKTERKAAAKAERRARREEGRTGKPCELCRAQSGLLIRCRVDASLEWRMVCRGCWDGVSGGVPDGDAEHPHYQYGGLWKQ